MSKNSLRLVTIVASICVAALFRLVPHPPNFTPIGAMALFSGAYLGRHWLALAAPLGALALSDLILGGYSGMIFQYAGTAFAVALGAFLLRRARSAPKVLGAAVGASLIFFIVSNFGVWLAGQMYPPTFDGLIACYVAAIPFFGNSLAGDLLFSALLFGGYGVAERAIPRLRPSAA